MLLEAMEEALRDKFAETHGVPKNLTIEHVMPQGWREHWPLAGGAPADARDHDVHTIGNLTLLNAKLNPRQSNRPWIDDTDPNEGKREALRDHSVLFLNKQLCQFEGWNEERIKHRSEELLALAVKIWPRAGS